MAQTLDLGSRIELVSMDLHFNEISIALYYPGSNDDPAYLVHTYSSLPGAAGRIETITESMRVLGGMETDAPGLLRYPCGHAHTLATKRLFLEACKFDPETSLQLRPLSIFDKKANANILIENLGEGRYEARPEEDATGSERRTTVISRGLIRLGEMEEIEDQPNQSRFGCGQPHDALIGLLLIRAPNVRSAMREVEEMASRGVLSAPSNQE